MEAKKESIVISVLGFIGLAGAGLGIIAITVLSVFNTLFGYDVAGIVEWIILFFLLFLLLAVLAKFLRQRERKRKTSAG